MSYLSGYAAPPEGSTPPPPGGTLGLPVAGELYVLTYGPTVNGQPVDVTAVDRIDLYATADRSGPPVVTILGPAVRAALGEYRFPPATMPPAGLYYAVVSFRVGTVTRTDRNRTLVVYAFDGTLGVPGPSPVLLSVTDARQLLRGRADGDTDQRLLRWLRTVDELVEQITGPLPAPGLIPDRYVSAAEIIFEHLWDHWQGAIPTDFQGGTDLDGNGSAFAGFAIPRAAREMLVVPKTAAARGPVGDFPPAPYYPDETWARGW